MGEGALQVIDSIRSLSDDDVLRRLSALLKASRRVEAVLVAHIGEVDARRLYTREASPSMFAYCLDTLHLSNHEAYLRITVARVSRQHPIALAMLAEGRIHLTAIAKLAPHLTAENAADLLDRATHLSKVEIEQLVASLAPASDAPSAIRRLPRQPSSDRFRARRRALSFRGPDRRTLSGPHPARIPSRRAARPWRGCHRREHPADVPDAQRVPGRARLRRGAHGPVPEGWGG
jgi:hypothetical protein